MYAQIKSVSAPSTTLRGFSWLPLATTLRVNVMVVFPPLKEQVAPATTDPLLGVVRLVDQYRFTASGEPEQITISASFIPCPDPTPSPIHPVPLNVIANETVTLSSDRVISPSNFESSDSFPPFEGVVTSADGDSEGDTAVALGEGDTAEEPDGTMAHLMPAPLAV